MNSTVDDIWHGILELGLNRFLVSAVLVGASPLSCTAHQSSTAPATPPVATDERGQVDDARVADYALTKGSERIVLSLKTLLQVDFYVEREIPQFTQLVGDVTEILEAYKRQGKGKFEFKLIDANTPALREQAKEQGVTAQPLDNGKGNGYLGLVLRYGSEKKVIPQLAPGVGLEFWITNKIREVRNAADHITYRVGVLTGKDELKLSDTNLVPRSKGSPRPSMQSIIEQAFPVYKFEEVELKGGGSAIDRNLTGLIIIEPQKDYDEKELRRIDEFLMLGGKTLVVYASAVSLKASDATMIATLSVHGLDKLLPGYGIQMNKDAVFDYRSPFRIGVPSNGGVTWLSHPGIPLVVSDPLSEGESGARLDVSFAPFFRMEEAIFPFASSLTLDKTKQPPDVKLLAVARTTSAASAVTSDTVDMKLRDRWEPKQPQEQRVIAAVAIGKLKSAFAGNSSDSSMRAVCAPSKSRVFVVSSSEFLTNPFAYAGNGPELGPVRGDPDLLMVAGPYTKYLTSTILSLKNTLDWMTGDEDLVDAALIGGHRWRAPPGQTVAAESKARARPVADGHATANGPRPPPNGIFGPGEADRAAAKGSPVALTLGSDGAEPRVLLDSAPKPGTKRSGSVELATQNDPQVGAIPIRFALSLEAQKLKKPTVAGGLATLVSFRITGAKINAPGVPADLSSALAKLNGSHIEYQVGADAIVSNIHSELANGADPLFSDSVRALADFLLDVALTVPSRPVGIGAYWTVTTRDVLMGLDVVTYRQVKVVKVEGNLVTLSLDSARYAASPAFELEGLPLGTPETMSEFRAQSEGTLTMVAGEAFPRSGKLDSLIHAKARTDDPNKSAIVQIRTRASISLAHP